jgi:Acetyltransferase (GNAT) family.
MVDAAVQGKGIGSKIFVGIESELKALGLSRVELAFAKGNTKSEKFLLKNGYQKTGQELNVPGYTVVVVEKML